MRQLAVIVGFCILAIACSSGEGASPTAPSATVGEVEGSSFPAASEPLGTRKATKGASSLPFTGTLEEATETASTVIVPGLYLVGSGTATHLGRFLLTADFARSIFANQPLETGTAAWTAANGDVLFADLRGIGVDLPFNPITSWREFYDITGGTGRFANASGRIIVERLRNDQTLSSTGTITGLSIWATDRRRVV